MHDGDNHDSRAGDGEHLRDLEFLRDSAAELLALDPSRDVYRFVGDRLAEWVPGALVAVNDYDPETGVATNRALCGNADAVARIAGLSALPPGQVRLPVFDEARTALMTGRLVDVPGGLHSLLFHAADPDACAAVERDLGITGLFAMGFSTGTELFGTVALVVTGGRSIGIRGRIEAFAQLAAVALRSRRAHEALGRVEARYARVAANLPGVTFQFLARRDGSMAFPFVSPRAREFCGIDASAFERDALLMFDLVHPEDRKTFRASIADCTARCVPWSWVGRILPVSGGTRWLHAASMPERTPEGDVLFDGVLIDITDRKQAEQELERARAEAEAASRAKTTLLAATSHDLRTPLAVVQGMLRLLLETPLDPRQREFAETALESGEHLVRLTDDLLDLSRIEAGRLVLERRPFRTVEPLEAAVRILEPAARSKGLTLATEVEPRVPPAVVGDPGRLRRLFLNLLDNAIKFTAAGGATVRLDAEPAPGNAIRLRGTVRDTGIGLPPGDHLGLFDPFVQGASAAGGDRPGAGLGLAICRGIVERMGGTIGFEESGGRGTTVRFTVEVEAAPPAEDGLASRGEGPPAGATVRRAAGRTRPLRVLLVEDHPAGRLILTRALSDLGHDVIAAGDGRGALAALDRAGRTPFDVVLLDLQLPDTDGWALLARIRASRRAAVRRVPVVAVTAHAGVDDEQRCREAGMDGFLRKPVRPEILAEALETIRSRRRRAPAAKPGRAPAGPAIPDRG
jgi:two-component system sensor histidine kinase EvgS